MDKNELLTVVKNWIELDDKIKSFQKQIRETEIYEKEARLETLVTTMRSNDIDCFELGQGNKLIYMKRKSKKPLSKRHLLASLAKFFDGNNIQAKELSKFIMDSREENVREDLRRKIPK